MRVSATPTSICLRMFDLKAKAPGEVKERREKV